MNVTFKERQLIQEYIHSLQEIEPILWKGNLGISNTAKDHPLTSLQYTVLFLVSLTFIFAINPAAFLHADFHYFPHYRAELLLTLTSVVLITGSLMVYQRELKRKRNETQYLLTSQRLIFILYIKGRVKLHSIPLENIRNIGQNDDRNLFIQTYHPVDFETYYYASNKTHSVITMVQVEYPNTVQRKIEQQMVIANKRANNHY